MHEMVRDNVLLRWSLSALVLLSLFSGSAASKTEPDAQTRLLAEIKQHLKGAEYETAIRKMEGLYALNPRPVILFNMAVAHDKRGAPCESRVAAYARFFEACDGCRSEAAALARRAQTYDACGYGTLKITAVPDDVRVSINGVDKDIAPLELRLAPGTYKIVGSKGPQEKSETVAITKGAAMSVRLVLDGAQQRASAVSEPGSEQDLVATISVENEDGLSAPSGAVVLAAGGLVVTGIGAYLMSSAADDESALESRAGRGGLLLQDFRDTKNEYETTHSIGLASVAIGSAAILGGLVWWAQWSPEKASAEMSIRPTFNGLQLHGVW